MIDKLYDFNEKELKKMSSSEIEELINFFKHIKTIDMSSITKLADIIIKAKEVLKSESEKEINNWFSSFREIIKEVSKTLKKFNENENKFNIKTSINGELNFWYLDKERKTKIKKFNSREGLYITKELIAKKNNINPKKVVKDIIFSSSIGFQIIIRQVSQNQNEKNFSLIVIKLQDNSDLVFSKKNLGMFVDSSKLNQNYDSIQGTEVQPNQNYYVYARAIRRKGKHGLITIFRIFKN